MIMSIPPLGTLRHSSSAWCHSPTARWGRSAAGDQQEFAYQDGGGLQGLRTSPHDGILFDEQAVIGGFPPLGGQSPSTRRRWLPNNGLC